MSGFVTKARGLFSYGNLDGDHNGVSLEMMSERSGMMSPTVSVRKRRRCVLIGSMIAGLAAIAIIAATIKNRQHIRAVAEALVKRANGLPSTSDDQSDPSSDTRRKINFDDFLHYTFYAESYNGTWLSDHEIMYLDKTGALSIYNLETLQKQILIESDKFLHLHPVSYEFSADRNYLLIKQSSQKVWRRSSFGSYVLLKFVNGVPQTTKLIPLKPNYASGDDQLNLNQYLRYVSWSPSGNAIAFVDYSNNLHYRHTAESEDIQLTKTGVDGVVYNGIPDWVSEEEVFEDNKALWWSPDGSRLVYGVFNDSLVDTVTLPRYGSWHQTKTDKQGYPYLQYPLQETIKYPKAGTTNPGVKLMAANVGGSVVSQHQLDPPHSVSGQEPHFSSVSWRDNHTAAVIWMNRVQNVSAINLCSINDDTRCHEVFLLPIRDGWVDYHFNIVFNKYHVSDRFLAILPAGSMKYRYRQLYVVDMQGSSRTQLTSQESEVTEVVEWSSDDTVWYVATLPGDPGSRHLYKLTIGRPGSECVTCDSQCQYASVTVSTHGSHYSIDCRGPGAPFSTVHRSRDNQALVRWTDNAALSKVMATVQMPRVQYLQVPVPGTDQKAQVVLYLPPHYQSYQHKLPMLVDVYGGPGFQKVDKSWQGHDWSMYVAGALGVVYAVIDPRGSGFQGDAWRHSVYRQFGSVEVSDTIAVTKYLQNSLDYVDKDRTAIWGWSYGGYLSLSVLTRDTQGVFRCGASVAPVVRWELYDTVYTERYMDTPSNNPLGYNASTPLWHLDNLRHKKYYLIHGTHDDNVHYQQSMMLSAALEGKDILFRQQAYPDQDHSINDYRRHLYHSLTNFFTEDCFSLP